MNRREPDLPKFRGRDASPPRLSADAENERRRELARQAAQIGAEKKPTAPAPAPDPTVIEDRYEAARRLADEIATPEEREAARQRFDPELEEEA